MRTALCRAALIALAIALGGADRARAQAPLDDEQRRSVASQLQNPIAHLTSVPLQNDFGIGPEDDFGYTLSLQPVFPFPIGQNVTVISRTILPVIDQPEIVPDAGRVFGLGDLTQSFFISPASSSAVSWGIGPLFVLPTASEDELGLEKWCIGPTAVAVVQNKGWTVGAMVNHVWSFAGDDERSDVSNTFLQPFLAYTFGSGLSATLQTETSYDWEANQWTIPFALGVSQVVEFGTLPVSFGLFGRYWAEGGVAAPDWGIRVPITFVLPGIGSRPMPATSIAPLPR